MVGPSARVGREGRRGLAFTLILVVLLGAVAVPGLGSGPSPRVHAGSASTSSTDPTNSSAVGNFTASVNRMVDLLALSGGGILALVWARVALSWFSNDVTKKVQAKDRARDALVGTLLFTAAITGLIWGLAHWVLTGA